MKNICVTTRKIDNPNYKERYSAISDDWLKFFNKINIQPILITDSLKDPNNFFNLNKCEGLILTNGESSRLTYNKDMKPNGSKRDLLEYKLVKICIKKKIPIFGICRGHQFINLFFKGRISEIKGHVNSMHKLDIIDKKYIKANKQKNLLTNSYHENCIEFNKIGIDLNPWAVKDNTVEAMENTQKKILSIMWHPERYTKYRKFDIELFKKHFNIK